MSPTIPITVLAVAVAGLLVGEKRDHLALKTLTKLTASTAFLVLAWTRGASESTYGAAVFTALVLSWIGDACLLSKRDGIFKAGIFAFLLGHVAFVIAFVVLGVDLRWLAGGALGVGAIAVGIERWLYPQVEAGFQVPVRAYIVVIAVMVSLSMGSYGAGHSWLIPTGAVAFFISDITVALERFVGSRFVNRLLGLPLYYGAQVLLALSIGA